MGVLTAPPPLHRSCQRDESLNDPVVFPFLSHPALNSNEAKQTTTTKKKKLAKNKQRAGTGARRRREVMHIVKTLFYCILIKVYKRPEPAGGRGLRSGWMEGRQVAFWLPWLLLFAFSRLGLFFLCWGKKKRENSLKKTKRHQRDTRSRSQKVCYTNGNKVRNTAEKGQQGETHGVSGGPRRLLEYREEGGCSERAEEGKRNLNRMHPFLSLT